jgi:hypothetical protein
LAALVVLLVLRVLLVLPRPGFPCEAAKVCAGAIVCEVVEETILVSLELEWVRLEAILVVLLVGREAELELFEELVLAKA